MYSKLFCGTLETSTQDSQQKDDEGFGLKLYKIELLKYHELAPILMRFLSSSECMRANGYHFLKDKNRFIICRTFLKLLLAEYLGLHVDKITLDQDSNKKAILTVSSINFF